MRACNDCEVYGNRHFGRSTVRTVYARCGVVVVFCHSGRLFHTWVLLTYETNVRNDKKLPYDFYHKRTHSMCTLMVEVVFAHGVE